MSRIIWVLAPLAALLLLACEVPRTVVGGGGSDDFDLPPMVLRYQKRGQFGNTDYEQRKGDMIECGLPKEYYRESLAYIFAVGPGETPEQSRARERKFRQCMRDKDYVQLGLSECGPVKENRGVCK